MDDFELQPLEPDDAEADAFNDDTFGDVGGVVGDDWKPDARAVGAFEALHATIRDPRQADKRHDVAWESQGDFPAHASAPHVDASRAFPSQAFRSLEKAGAPDDGGFCGGPLPAFFTEGGSGPPPGNLHPRGFSSRAREFQVIEQEVREENHRALHHQGPNPLGNPLGGSVSAALRGDLAHGLPRPVQPLQASELEKQLLLQHHRSAGGFASAPHAQTARRSTATEHLDKLIHLKRQQAHAQVGPGGRDRADVYPAGAPFAYGPQADLAPAPFGRGDEGREGPAAGLAGGPSQRHVDPKAQFLSSKGLFPPGNPLASGPIPSVHREDGAGKALGLGVNDPRAFACLAQPPSEEDERMVQDLLKDANVTAAALAALSAAEAAVAAARAQGGSSGATRAFAHGSVDLSHDGVALAGFSAGGPLPDFEKARGILEAEREPQSLHRPLPQFGGRSAPTRPPLVVPADADVLEVMNVKPRKGPGVSPAKEAASRREEPSDLRPRLPFFDESGTVASSTLTQGEGVPAHPVERMRLEEREARELEGLDSGGERRGDPRDRGPLGPLDSQAGPGRRQARVSGSGGTLAVPSLRPSFGRASGFGRTLYPQGSQGRSLSPLPASASRGVSGGVDREKGRRRGEATPAPEPQDDIVSVLRSCSLFPLTKAHRDAVVQQRLPELPPFRVPAAGSAVSATPESGASARPGPSGPRSGHECLMTAFDLDHILRMHLAQMAKLPQLQRCSGRWNFRFLMRHHGALGSAPHAGADGVPSQRGGSLAERDSGAGATMPEPPSSALGLEKEISRVFRRQQQEFELLQQHRAAWGGGASRRDAEGQEGDEWCPPAALPPQFGHAQDFGIGVTVSSCRMHPLLLGSLSFAGATELLQLYLAPCLLSVGGPTAAQGEGRRRVDEKETLAFAALEDATRDGEEDPDRELSHAEKEQRRLQKKFGKQTYSTVRQPRNCIHLAPTGGQHSLAQILQSPSLCAVRDESPAREDGERTGTDQEVEGDSAREASAKLVRALVFGSVAPQRDSVPEKRSAPATEEGEILSAFADGVLARRVVEDAFDLLLEAASLHSEILECPASHVAARSRLQDQQQHLMLQLFELVTLRHNLAAAENSPPTSAVATLYFLPFLLDAHVPASTVDVAAYHRRYVQLQQLQLAESRQPELRAQLEEARELLAEEVEKGRQASRWMLSGLYELPKGRQLLARALRLFSDVPAAALLQILLASPTVLPSLCSAVDHVLLFERNGRRKEGRSADGRPAVQNSIANVRASSGSDGRTPDWVEDAKGEEKGDLEAENGFPSSVLLNELLLLQKDETQRSTEPADQYQLIPVLLKKSQESGMDDDSASPACALYIHLISRLLHVANQNGHSQAAAISAAFLVGVYEQIAWGWNKEQAAELLQYRSGCCLLALLLALLPPPSSLTPYQERTAVVPFLTLAVSALVLAVRETAEEEKSGGNNGTTEVLLPLIQAVVQQARADESRAKAITVAAMNLLGVAGAQAMLSSFLAGAGP
uniref:Uncharacterized protein n=1 Tax=Toxoplasma gondii COUG TaxID=1074873 RepID=A0A2G8YAS5_TOXGO|nr:hypothetical protein TGCOUG_250700 [Toxoplasma gondii COUG]